jgi:copper chaperone CopZ
MRRLLTMVVASIMISCSTPIQHAKIAIKDVSGNCGMCKKTIEKAGNIDGVSMVEWDKDTKKATITIDSTKTTFDQVLQRIAESGYDNEAFKGNDKSYEGLHECCKYERSK